jgi:hypothetical protein
MVVNADTYIGNLTFSAERKTEDKVLVIATAG